MNHNLSLLRIRFETLEVRVHEETRTLNTSSIQERSTTGVKGYLVSAKNKDKFALSISLSYTAHDISNQEQPQELTVLNGKISAFFETDAWTQEQGDWNQEAAEKFLQDVLIYKAQVLYETAIQTKLKELLSDFGIRSNLPLGRITAGPV